MAPLDVDKLALPAAGFSPVPLSQLIGEGPARSLVQGLRDRILPKEEARRRAEVSGFRRPYHDPGLTKNRSRYLRLLRALQARGLLGFKRNVKETVGLFAVWKKNGDQRLILDGRSVGDCFWIRPRWTLPQAGHLGISRLVG